MWHSVCLHVQVENSAATAPQDFATERHRVQVVKSQDTAEWDDKGSC